MQSYTADGNQRIRIREKMLEFSTVYNTLSTLTIIVIPPSVFLWSSCPSCHRTNSFKALKELSGNNILSQIQQSILTKTNKKHVN